jgi:hypothetical protein
MKRYYAVTSDRSTKIHIKREDNRSEGLTRCGRYISALWHWSTGKARGSKQRCKVCYS